MSELHFSWLELSVLVPLVGAAVVRRVRDAELARKTAVGFALLALLGTLAAWQDYRTLSTFSAHDPWDLGHLTTGRDLLVIDAISAPLLTLTALLYLLTMIITLRTKLRRFSFSWTLVSEALALATLSCGEPWGLVALLTASTLPPWFELRARHKPTRVFVLHMLLFVLLLVLGWSVVEWEGRQRTHTLWAVVPLLAAVLLRSGVVPVHCWMTDLFEHATFGTALLYVVPITGAYAALRLVLPVAPDWVLRSIGLLSLLTAVYAAGMALVQREARRFFCYLFLSHSSLVLVGLETITPIGLTGALCVWMSVILALGGFGLTLRALEGRRGRLSLEHFAGGYEQTPTLAVFFLLTGMASVGFPGTIGFLGTELLVDGAVQTYPHVGVAVVVATALNGIAVVRAYFLLFTGARAPLTVGLTIRRRELLAVLTLALLLLGGGLYPQPGVASRYQAARQLLRRRDLAQQAASRLPGEAAELAQRPEAPHSAPASPRVSR